MIQTHRYFLNNDEHQEGWNLVILDQDGNECTLFASGDYGKYAARFYFEKDFREAFLDFSKEYLLRKISKQSVFDGESTLKEIKRYILRLRLEGYWDREEARKEWDQLEKYDFYFVEEYGRWIGKTGIDYIVAVEFGAYKYPAGAVAFAEQTLPRLKQLISKEIESEKQSFISRVVGAFKKIKEKILWRKVA